MRFLVGILALAVALAVGAALAGGFSDTYSLGTGAVTVSNTQENSSWVPVSVLILYATPGSGTAKVWRVSQSYQHQLAGCSFSNVTSIVWVPNVEYPFTYGDALLIQSTVTNGVVQVIRKGD